MQYENVINIDENVFLEAKNLIIKWGGKFSLKTLDALHLAFFVQLAQLNQVTFVLFHAIILNYLSFHTKP